MRYVLVQVGEDQQQFEHAVALLRVRYFRASLEIIYDHQRVRQQPFERFRIDGVAGAAALERLIRTHESFVKKMVQAKLFGNQSARNRVVARVPPTRRCSSKVHDPPRKLESYGTVARA